VKILAMIVGAAILFTTAHVTIFATGGYGGSHAYITLAVAAGVAVASILVGRAWGEHRRTLAGS
jgi:ABC-type phosphate/phosphonate transport system substrate-binding protein